MRMPWFAGYCGVMVNVDDIYAMGGRPTAVVDALWAPAPTPARLVLRSLAGRRRATACRWSAAQQQPQRAAAAGRGHPRPCAAPADQLRCAAEGDLLLMAVDLRGGYEEPFPYWNASTRAPAARLRADLELLPALAEDGLCATAKDISMAGAVGTALMLLECSGVGAHPHRCAARPPGVPLMRWLSSFPSYGFVLSVPPVHAATVLARFAARDIACAVVGEVDASRAACRCAGGEDALLWDLDAAPFIQPPSSRPAREPAHA